LLRGARGNYRLGLRVIRLKSAKLVKNVRLCGGRLDGLLEKVVRRVRIPLNHRNGGPEDIQVKALEEHSLSARIFHRLVDCPESVLVLSRLGQIRHEVVLTGTRNGAGAEFEVVRVHLLEVVNSELDLPQEAHQVSHLDTVGLGLNFLTEG
jgi:hypothetical protein